PPWRTPSGRTSSVCSRPSAGTRRKPHVCSTSAAAPSTGRSSSTASNPTRPPQLIPDLRTICDARLLTRIADADGGDSASDVELVPVVSNLCDLRPSLMCESCALINPPAADRYSLDSRNQQT